MIPTAPLQANQTTPELTNTTIGAIIGPMAPSGQRFGAYARLLIVVTALAIISIGHFMVGVATHRLHVLHLALSLAYLLPIVAGAIWFALPGGMFSAFLATAAFYAHMRLSWAGQPMENANQWALIGVFWLIAIVTGLLQHLRDLERDNRLAAERHAQREVVIRSIAALAGALQARDENTSGHSEYVSRLAVAVGRELGLEVQRLDRLRLAALVHDIGKIGVRDDVLLKPGRLTWEERWAMKRHPAIAAQILQPIEGAAEIAAIVLAHHECPDGSGYPNGRPCSQIPVEAHILRVADVFASLIESRPYKAAMEVPAALEEMRRMCPNKLEVVSFSALSQLADKQGRMPMPSNHHLIAAQDVLGGHQ